MGVKRVIAVVREDSNGQRRITIPRYDKILKDGDFVELKKVIIK